MTLVGMGRRPKPRFDFEAVRTAIGAALRTHYSEVLREPIPDRMAELLKQLDQPPESGPGRRQSIRHNVGKHEVTPQRPQVGLQMDLQADLVNAIGSCTIKA